jgi:amino acid transporter
VALGMNKEIVDHTSIEKSASYFINLAPILGIGLSIPAIFFSFDGFYCSTSLYDKLEKKNAFTKGMIVGLLIVSVIYIFCSISLILLNIDGSLEEGELVPN